MSCVTCSYDLFPSGQQSKTKKYPVYMDVEQRGAANPHSGKTATRDYVLQDRSVIVITAKE